MIGVVATPDLRVEGPMKTQHAFISVAFTAGVNIKWVADCGTRR